MTENRREYEDISQTETLSKASLLLVLGGCVAVTLADRRNIHLIAGGYSAITTGAVAWGALRGHAKIMEQVARHHNELLAVLNENKAILTDNSARDELRGRMARIEATLGHELDTLGAASEANDIARRRNSR